MTASRLLCAVLSIPALVSGQAWLSPKGDGTVALSYQNMFVSDHVYENGDAHDIGLLSPNLLFEVPPGILVQGAIHIIDVELLPFQVA